jgi:protein-L-isoaspartate(D-aspartate) O-methyltransferase
LTERTNSGTPVEDAALVVARGRMVTLLRRYIHDDRVIDAMASVPREAFVPAHLRARAYDDSALPIGEGQTISQPLMVALSIQAAQVKPEDRVLEVGTGSGYQAAVLSRLAREVVSVERIESLRKHAEAALSGAGFTNVEVHQASDVLGWPARGPYDAIVVAAGAPHVPRALLDQLAPGGRLVIPIGERQGQELVRATNTEHGVELARLGACAFVPLIGEEAWETGREASNRH